MDDNKETIQEFVAESLDGLTAVDHSLLELEKIRTNPSILRMCSGFKELNLSGKTSELWPLTGARVRECPDLNA